jgi:hypothetical protein
MAVTSREARRALERLSHQRSRSNLLMRWTADGTSGLRPSGLRDFQPFKSPEYDIAEQIDGSHLYHGTRSMVMYDPWTYTSFLNPMART